MTPLLPYTDLTFPFVRYLSSCPLRSEIVYKLSIDTRFGDVAGAIASSRTSVAVGMTVSNL